MLEVTHLTIYWYDKREWKSTTEHGDRKEIRVIPSGPSIVQIKMDTARALSKIMRHVVKYYVVASAERPDGTLLFRTVVPMVVM